MLFNQITIKYLPLFITKTMEWRQHAWVLCQRIQLFLYVYFYALDNVVKTNIRAVREKLTFTCKKDVVWSLLISYFRLCRRRFFGRRIIDAIRFEVSIGILISILVMELSVSPTTTSSIGPRPFQPAKRFYNRKGKVRWSNRRKLESWSFNI